MLLAVSLLFHLILHFICTFFRVCIHISPQKNKKKQTLFSLLLFIIYSGRTIVHDCYKELNQLISISHRSYQVKKYKFENEIKCLHM